MSNGFATISASGLVTFTGGFEYDTAIYTVSNTCGTVSARFSMHTFCEFAVHPVNNTTTISITPNPTTGSITITGAINVNIKIYNTLGQLINQVNSTDHCSLSAFPVGLYLVRVFNEQGVLIKQDKIIKK